MKENNIRVKLFIFKPPASVRQTTTQNKTKQKRQILELVISHQKVNHQLGFPDEPIQKETISKFNLIKNTVPPMAYYFVIVGNE